MSGRSAPTRQAWPPAPRGLAHRVGRRVRGGGGGGDRAGARRFVNEAGLAAHPRRALRSPTMSATAVDRPSAAPRLLFAAALGALVAVALGVYGRVHDPSQELVFTLFFSSTIAMKVWLGSVAAALAVVQVISAMWVYGRLPGRARPSGRAAFTGSPGAWPSSSPSRWPTTACGRSASRTPTPACWPIRCSAARSTAPSPARSRSCVQAGLPGLALPVAGGIMFAVLIGAWLTSALWFIDESGWPAL